MLSVDALGQMGSVLSALGVVCLPLSIVLGLAARQKANNDTFASQSLGETIEHLGEGFYRCALDGRLSSANPVLVAINGYSSEYEMIKSVQNIGNGWYVDPNRRDEFKRILTEEGRVRNFVSEVYRHKTRARIWVSENARMVVDAKTGKPSHYEGTVVEITEIAAGIREEGLLRKLTSHVPGGLFQMVRHTNRTFDVVFASVGFTDLLGMPAGPTGFDIKLFVSLINPDDLANYFLSLQTSRKTRAVWVHDFRITLKTGQNKWLRVQATPEFNLDGSTLWHGYLQDVTVNKSNEAAIRSLAYSDVLTKLPNRRFLIEHMEKRIAECKQSGEYGAVLFIDLDNFKQINDIHGHDVGDLLLIGIGKRLSEIVRDNDFVARLAGDEFVILLDALGSDKQEASQKAALIAEKVSASFQQDFNLGQINHRATASIGGLTFGGDHGTVDDILRLADTAMYEVKKAGRNSFKIYDRDAEFESGGRADLLMGLNDLVARNELELRFQPQLDRSGAIYGAEALIRWNHPQLGLLTPDRFMSLAEQGGQIGPINDWILETAVKKLHGWQQNATTAHLKLAINIGQNQFNDKNFANALHQELNQLGVNPSSLTLELSESLMTKDLDHNICMMKKLKSTGVSLSLADFGVTFSSLSLLKEMPLDEIKIEGSFVKSMQDRKQDEVLVKSILAMADALGLSTAAEHVETQAQEKLLMEYGCVIFQGFLYGGAMSQDDFEMAVLHNVTVNVPPRDQLIAA